MANEERKTGTKKLYRSRRDRMIGGVCAGLAEYFGLDVTLIRIIFLVSILFGGTGILIYLISIIVIPENPEEKEHPSPRETERKPAETSLLWGALLIAVGAMFLLDRMDIIPLDYFFSFRYSFRLLLPLFLILIGLFIIVRKENGSNNGERRLYRSEKDKMIAGVAAGMGHYLRIDPALMRIIWVIGTILTHGIRIIIYLILAIVLPKKQEETEATS